LTHSSAPVAGFRSSSLAAAVADHTNRAAVPRIAKERLTA